MNLTPKTEENKHDKFNDEDYKYCQGLLNDNGLLVKTVEKLYGFPFESTEELNKTCNQYREELQALMMEEQQAAGRT